MWGSHILGFFSILGIFILKGCFVFRVLFWKSNSLGYKMLRRGFEIIKKESSVFEFYKESWGFSALFYFSVFLKADLKFIKKCCIHPKMIECCFYAESFLTTRTFSLSPFETHQNSLSNLNLIIKWLFHDIINFLYTKSRTYPSVLSTILDLTRDFQAPNLSLIINFTDSKTYPYVIIRDCL